MFQSVKYSIILSIVAGTLFMSCDHTQNKHQNMGNDQPTKSESLYACPMHPEQTGKQSEKCPKCGMELQPAGRHEETQYEISLSTLPNKVDAGKEVVLILSVRHKDKFIPLDKSHEKKLHLIVVSEDLSWFRHIHPEEQEDSTLTVKETFPFGGRYILFADYKPSGGPQTLSKLEIEVNGDKAVKPEGASKNKMDSYAGGYTVRLENGDDLKTNRSQPLKISIQKSGKTLKEKDLELYLGAAAHMVMIGGEDKQYLHIHPVADEQYTIRAETYIKKAGPYRMWVQFQINGKVHTADFSLNVEQGDQVHAENHHLHSH